MVKIDNPFDRALKVRQVPEPFLGAAVDVTATLELAWDAARAVFEEAAQPAHAIAICELMLLAAHRIPAGSGNRLSAPHRSDTE